MFRDNQCVLRILLCFLLSMGARELSFNPSNRLPNGCFTRQQCTQLNPKA